MSYIEVDNNKKLKFWFLSLFISYLFSSYFLIEKFGIVLWKSAFFAFFISGPLVVMVYAIFNIPNFITALLEERAKKKEIV